MDPIKSMDHWVILKIELDGKTKLVRVNQSSFYKDVVNEVCDVWPNLCRTNLVMYYSVGCVNNCCLLSDSDFSGLLEFCHISSEKLVNVSIEAQHLNVQGNEMQNSTLIEEDIPFIDEYSGVVVPEPVFKESNVDEHNINRDASNLSYRSNARKKSVSKNSQKSVENYSSTEFTGLCSIPNFDISPNEKQKTYLSDHWGSIMKTGEVFLGGAPEFRIELMKYSTKLNFGYIYRKNTPRYVYVVCSENSSASCDWFIKAKKLPMNTGFIVSKANLLHKCVGSLLLEDKNRLGIKLIKELILPSVRDNPTITVDDVIKYIKRDYGFDLTYSKAWRGIEAARDDIFGSYDESYDQLRWYIDAVKRTNPGSIADLEKNHITNHFERLFVSFNACKEGFKKCRPLLFIDGTFFKGRSKGVLLAATAKDGNNGLFPVAFAIVSSENRNNWAWFLTKLRDLITHSQKVIYISDRNTGLMSAFYDVWKDPAHFYCLYHLLSNLRGRYGGGWNTQHRENMADLFKQCAYAPNSRIFNEKMHKFKEVGGEIAEEWLKDLPYGKWAVAHSPHVKRYGEMTSNAAESFNFWIREARGLPVTFMIDSIRQEISRWFVERREASSKWTGLLVPSKEKLWHELGNISDAWTVSLYPNGQFLVSSKTSVTVDLEYNICTCFEWQIKGFPCAHAVAVIKRHCESVHNVIEECFFTSSYKQCYSVDLMPVPQTERYEYKTIADSEKILPPILHKPPGRPKQKRITSYGEFRKIKPTICKKCGKKGRHDSLTCALVLGTDKTNTSN